MMHELANLCQNAEFIKLSTSSAELQDQFDHRSAMFFFKMQVSCSVSPLHWLLNSVQSTKVTNALHTPKANENDHSEHCLICTFIDFDRSKWSLLLVSKL